MTPVAPHLPLSAAAGTPDPIGRCARPRTAGPPARRTFGHPRGETGPPLHRREELGTRRQSPSQPLGIGYQPGPSDPAWTAVVGVRASAPANTNPRKRI